jgi:hypothetical protein
MFFPLCRDLLPSFCFLFLSLSHPSFLSLFTSLSLHLSFAAFSLPCSVFGSAGGREGRKKRERETESEREQLEKERADESEPPLDSTRDLLAVLE